MPVVHLPSRLFAILCESFAVAASDPDAPLDRALLDAVQGALARARARRLPGLGVVITLTPPELAVLAAYFEAGCGAGRDDTRCDAIATELEVAARVD